LSRTLARGAHLAVILRGPKGSLASTGDDVQSGAALPVDVRDTTGAGDSFIAGFLSAHLARRPLAECLAQGHSSAAHTCRIFGGFAQDEDM
jgi:fructoselysine 6-kinase